MKCERISATINVIQQYSKLIWNEIVGMPQVSDQETSVQTANLCIKLFLALGAARIDIIDLDTAHRVLTREALNRPNAIICKFTSRLTPDEAMTKRNKVRNLWLEDLTFDPSVKVDSARFYDHLIPRVQELLFKAKSFQGTTDSLSAGLRMDPLSWEGQSLLASFKLSCIEDLIILKSSYSGHMPLWLNSKVRLTKGNLK